MTLGGQVLKTENKNSSKFSNINNEKLNTEKRSKG